MRVYWILLTFFLALPLGGCSLSQTVVGISPTLAPEETDIVYPFSSNATATVTAKEIITVATSTVNATGAWKTYHNVQAGYSVEYPAGWIVSEQVGTDGSIVTNFSATDGGGGIMVLVQHGEFAGADNSDIPNTRCEQVMIGGTTGMRCFDTINFATSTTVVSNDQTFTIASLGKRIGLNSGLCRSPLIRLGEEES